MLHLREGKYKTTTSVLRKPSDVGHQEMLLLYLEANAKVLLSHLFVFDCSINNLTHPNFIHFLEQDIPYFPSYKKMENFC